MIDNDTSECNQKTMEEKLEELILIDNLKKKYEFNINSGENKTFVFFLINGENYEGEIKVLIQGKNTKVQILGIIIGYKNQQIKIITLQDHLAGESTSDLYVKSALFDNAKFSYEGMIRFKKNAQKLDAYQKNQNLILSQKANANTKPHLEILANEVRCTHAVTVGDISDDLLYYLNTRGLNKLQAKYLILSGYFEEILQRIKDIKIRNRLKKNLHNKLLKLFGLKIGESIRLIASIRPKQKD